MLTNITCTVVRGASNFSFGRPPFFVDILGFQAGDTGVFFNLGPDSSTLECTFTNTAAPALGSIAICKETPNHTGIVGPFVFTNDGGGLPSFPLSSGDCHTFNNLDTNASPYVFSEASLVFQGEDWSSYEIDCTGGTTTTTNHTVTINLKPGEHITCNFLNSFVVGVGPVGGVTELLVDDSNSSAARTVGSGGSIPYATLAAGAAAVLAVFGAGGWYGRRRWLR